MTKEQDLAATLGISLQELRDFRTQDLDEETHYEPKPFRYTDAGVKVATDWFTKGLTPPDTSLPVEVKIEVPAGPAQPITPAPRRLSPLIPPGLLHPLEGYAYPIVTRIPPNRNLVVCDVGPFHNVRVAVKDNTVYVPRMTMPMAVKLEAIGDHGILYFTAKGPRRKGCW